MQLNLNQVIWFYLRDKQIHGNLMPETQCNEKVTENIPKQTLSKMVSTFCSSVFVYFKNLQGKLKLHFSPENCLVESFWNMCSIQFSELQGLCISHFEGSVKPV